MEVRVYTCTECSRVVQVLDDELGRTSEHRCPRHPYATLIYKGNIYYTILVAPRA